MVFVVFNFYSCTYTIYSTTHSPCVLSIWKMYFLNLKIWHWLICYICIWCTYVYVYCDGGGRFMHARWCPSRPLHVRFCTLRYRCCCWVLFRNVKIRISFLYTRFSIRHEHEQAKIAQIQIHIIIQQNRMIKYTIKKNEMIVLRHFDKYIISVYFWHFFFLWVIVTRTIQFICISI